MGWTNAGLGVVEVENKRYEYACEQFKGRWTDKWGYLRRMRFYKDAVRTRITEGVEVGFQ